MSNKRDRKGLGRGLSALMADIETASERRDTSVGGSETTPTGAEGGRTIPIDQITANPDQPRRDFAEAALAELAESIRENGILQPLILRPHPDDQGRYQIVAGERRWRAAQRARLHEVPALVRDLTDTEVLEFGIIENIQRADLNPLEEAQGYRQLVERFGHTQEQVATAMGKSRSHIANLMRLLSLPEDVLAFVRSGELSAGHARALITLDDPSALARMAVAKGLSVREVEALVKSRGDGGAKPKASGGAARKKDADTLMLEGDLKAATGLAVSIDHKSDSTGKLSISYNNLEELDRIIAILNRA